MNELILENLKAAFTEMFAFVDWKYMVVFILLTWLFNSYTFSTKKATKLKQLQKVPAQVWALIIGLILAMFWIWAFSYQQKDEIVSLVFSLLGAMVLYKFGIDKLLNFINSKTIKTH